MRSLYILLLFLVGGVGWAQVIPDSSWVIKNISALNSIYDDYLPFWCDSVLLFTSNRTNDLEPKTLEHSEKVYFCSYTAHAWGKVKKDWYKFNSDNNTALIGVDDSLFYFYRSYWPNNGELFCAQRRHDPRHPNNALVLTKLKQINSDYNEVSITTYADTIYFVSNRDGNYNIFMQVGQQAAVSLDILNSDYDEMDVFVSKDGQNLFFSSNRSGGLGGYDIYQSRKTFHQWTSPILLSAPINTTFDDRDFRWYSDTTIFLSSSRDGGQGGLDLWWLQKKPSLVSQDSIPLKKDTLALSQDSLPLLLQPDKTMRIPEDSSIHTQDTLRKERDELIEQLNTMNIEPFRAEIQLGAYRYISSVEAFIQKFSCLPKEAIRMDKIFIENTLVHKFIIDTTYSELDPAINMQMKIIALGCLPQKSFVDTPFIALLDRNNNRLAIFWKKDEYSNNAVFYILKNGKQVWKGKRF